MRPFAVLAFAILLSGCGDRPREGDDPTAANGLSAPQVKVEARRAMEAARLAQDRGHR